MDGHDRKELSAARIKALSREEHLKKYGSFLFCPQRNTLCVHMDGMWQTGCEREICILDDPDYQLLQKRIEVKRKMESMKARHDEHAAPVRNQTGRIRSYRQQKLDEIHRLEERSRKAYYSNNPQLGDTLFNKARYLRGELKKWEDERDKVKDAIDSI